MKTTDTLTTRLRHARGLLAGRLLHCALALVLLAANVAAGVTGFSQGVASGDVTATSAVVWTRTDWLSVVRFDLSTDEDFASVQQTAEIYASQEDDFTVKLNLADLSPDTEYFYRFVMADEQEHSSAVGRFRTAPAADEDAALRFAFSGDVGYRFAPFPIFTQVANEQPDFLVWFGDTIYADDIEAEGGAAVTLADYRGKYRQIRADSYAQNALADVPVWVGWDDHEVFDNYAGTDPNLSPDQQAAAYQAFFEYMPLVEQNVDGDPFRTYRRFRWGSQVEFFIIDGRQYRDPSADAVCGLNPDPLGLLLGPLSVDSTCINALAEPRSMLGQEQFDWLTSGLAESTARVKFVINDVPLSAIGLLPADRWDGYDSERKALLEFINQNQITGVYFLTTDFHSNWYNPDVMRFFRARRSDYDLPNDVPVVEAVVGPLGVETMYESILGFVADALGHPLGPLMRGLLGSVENNVAQRLRCQGGFDLIETNRRSYLVVDVTPAGDVEITYRGLSPSEADDPNAVAETFYTSDETPSAS